MTNLFLDDGTRRLMDNATYPIDIHRLSLAMITFSELSDFDFQLKEMTQKVSDWSIVNMEIHSGVFTIVNTRTGQIQCRISAGGRHGCCER